MSQTHLTLQTKSVLTTQPVPAIENPKHLNRTESILGIVTGIQLPDGTIHENPHHFRESRRYILDKDPTLLVGLRLPSEKAKRLVEFFRRLRPGHGFMCHDLVAAVEDMSQDSLMSLPIRLIKDSEVKSGVSYAVAANIGSRSNPDWRRPHSGIGADDGRLLGLVGQGMMVALMRSMTAKNVYAKTVPASIAQIIIK